jgi:hypothetical protein
MYGWNLTLNSARRPLFSRERWPVGYSFQALTRPFSFECSGALKVRPSAGCCAISINRTLSLDFLSAATVATTMEDPLEMAPQSARGALFCVLEARTRNVSTLYGMDSAYYHATGTCIEPDSVRCYPNGTVAIYPVRECIGVPFLQQLTTTPWNFSTRASRDVRGYMMTLEKGQGRYSWKMFIQTSDYFISMRYWYEWVLMGLYATALSLLIYSCYYYMKRIWKHRTLYLTFVFLDQFFWLGFVITKITGHFGIFNSVISGTNSLFQMGGSLFAVLNTITFVLDMYKTRNSYRQIVYGLLFLIHFSMNWNHYTRFFPMPGVFTRTVVQVTLLTNITWLVIMMVFDCIPPLLVIHKLLSTYKASFKTKLETVWKGEPWFLIIFGGQVITLIAFVSQELIRNYSEILGHDRVWLVFQAVDAFCQTIFAVLNTLLVDRMVAILKAKSLAIKGKPNRIQLQESKTMAVKSLTDTT